MMNLETAPDNGKRRGSAIRIQAEQHMLIVPNLHIGVGASGVAQAGALNREIEPGHGSLRFRIFDGLTVHHDKGAALQMPAVRGIGMHRVERKRVKALRVVDIVSHVI